MEIYIVRHTAVDVPKGFCYGQMDVDILPGVEKEAERIWSELPTEKDYDIVLSSPLQRCTKLAHALGLEKSDGDVSQIANNNSDKLLFSTDPRLMELNFGDWEGQNWNDLQEEADEWMKNWVTFKTKNGESVEDFRDRIIDLLDELKSKGYKKVLLISHSGVIRLIQCITQNEALDTMFSYDMEFGAVRKFSYY
jgi:alpha-ribazole phosphatase